jgi:hypothetical protein
LSTTYSLTIIINILAPVKMKFFFTVGILLSVSLAATSHDGVDSQLHWKDTSPSTSASQNTQELQAHNESRENHNIDDSAFPKVLPDVIEDDTHRDHHPISTKNHLPWMTIQEPKLNNADSAFPEVLPNIIKDDAHRDHHPISTKNHLPWMTTQEPKLNNADSAFPRSTTRCHRR